MGTKSKAEFEMGMLRAAWDLFRKLQVDLQGVVTIYGNASGRPSCFTWRFVFTPLVETDQNYLGSCAVQFEYPNGRAQTLAASFYDQALELEKVAHESARAARTVKRNGN